MEPNLLLEQYSRYKKSYLEQSPYKCLLDTNIELNPHQINAFCAAIDALETGGIILADEVGLGKTIEAGLVLKYVLDTGAKKILIVLPAALRKQWEIELAEKFELTAKILDRSIVERDYRDTKKWLENKNEIRIIITSYDYAPKLNKRFPEVMWDFIIIDEAHNLRNVFHGTKRAKRLYDMSGDIPKILLTATPLQNSLNDLHGLVSFIDPKIFGAEETFNKQFIVKKEYDKLKKTILPVIYRTLRKDVGKYMEFTKRECITVDFHLTRAEKVLYERVNAFLRRKKLYSIPTANRGLIILVIRKLLASSSFALIETFTVLEKRLLKLYQGKKSADAQEGFELFWDFLEDERNDDNPASDDEKYIQQLERQEIKREMDSVQSIISAAKEIKTNAKIAALKTAIEKAFGQQVSMGIPEKVVIFTESKRTQKYIAAELRRNGYSDDDILLFNGDFDDVMTKDIYKAWQIENFGKTNYGRNIEYKHAIVNYFRKNARILIVTDVASEGLNLQFCNTVINYDLPWNPQKIEQRIGRCHRYGQKHNVVAINLLNTENEADKRVYEILQHKFELFEGVFGASDVALGTLESGSGFEKMILDIYQKCSTETEFKNAFNKLDKKINSDRNKRIIQLRSLLLTESTESKGKALAETKARIEDYLQDVEYWGQFADPEVDGTLHYWEIRNWGKDRVGGHGVIFIGAFCNNTTILSPVLALCDESGEYVDFEEKDIVRILESVDDVDVHEFKPTKEELDSIAEIYDRLKQEKYNCYLETVKHIKEYNMRKMKNWARIRKQEFKSKIKELSAEFQDLLKESSKARDSLERDDIKKKAERKKKRLDNMLGNYEDNLANIDKEIEKEIANFNKKFDIKPILVVNIVLRY